MNLRPTPASPDAASATVHPQDFEKALETYKSYLARHELLFTRERVAILEEVMARHDHFSVEELHDSLKLSGKKVSRATLYRNLESLKDAGIISDVDLGRRHLQYEHVVGHSQHIHLVCAETGEVVEEHCAELDELLQRLAQKHGLEVLSYKAQIQVRPARS